MNRTPDLRTARLWLRPWRPSDFLPFASLNADPRVMEHLPAPLSRIESDALAARIQQHFADQGFGLWAVEVPGTAEFVGFIGLSVPRFSAAFTPCVEVGWRLAYEHWGRGYATEGAAAVLHFGFQHLHLAEIVSFTVPANLRSRRVMERLCMQHTAADDFEHPLLPSGHPQRHHVLYRLARSAWISRPQPPWRSLRSPRPSVPCGSGTGIPPPRRAAESLRRDQPTPTLGRTGMEPRRELAAH